MHNTFIDKQKTRDELQKASTTLSKKLAKISHHGLTQQFYPLAKNSYHMVAKLLEPQDSYERLLFKHILNIAYRTELLSAGAGYLTVNYATAYMKFLERYYDELEKACSRDGYGSVHYRVMEHNHKKEEEVRELVRNNIRPVTEKEITDTVNRICEDPVLAKVLLEAISLAGIEGNIHIEDSQQTVYGVELRHGYSFGVSCSKMFLNSFGVWDSYDAKILCVDGIVDKVSEIEKLLQQSVETKIPLVIIAQGFSEEVIATVKTNNIRGVFNIMLVKLEQALENLNVLNDIAAAAGSDVVSSLKGDMLIYVNHSDLPIMEYIKATETELLIRNTKSRANVASQIKLLLEKKAVKAAEVFEGYDFSQMLDKRIGNLLAHSVVVRLPNMAANKREATKVVADIVLRTVRTMLTHGVVDVDKLKRDVDEKSYTSPEDKLYLYSFKEMLESIEHQTAPALSVFATVKFTSSVLLNIYQTSGAIVSLV